MESALLSIDELADRLAVSRSTIYRHVLEMGIPSIRVGGQLRFDPADVQGFIDTQKEASAWESYSAALRAGNGQVHVAASRLGIDAATVALHTLALSEHARLTELAGDLPAAEQEFHEAHRIRADGQIGGLPAIIPELQERQDRVAARVSRAHLAAHAAESIVSEWPFLFGFRPEQRVRFTGSLPQVLLARMAEIKQARIDREAAAAKARLAQEKLETMPWRQGRKQTPLLEKTPHVR